MSAQGLSVALPLRIDARDGAYGLNKNLLQVAEQNLKMVILTAPGERIMFPEFGVGVRNYLFEQNNSGLIGNLVSKNSKPSHSICTFYKNIRSKCDKSSRSICKSTRRRRQRQQS
jgi:hypothetical protein